MRSDGVSGEDRLILLLARARLAADLEVDARLLLGKDLSWPLILKRARGHDVAPLLTRNLERLGFPGVPAEARAELDATCRMNAARSALLARELTHVLGIFDWAEIPAIPLKGVALAHWLYGDVTRRSCVDIDVLVPRHAVTRAVAVLRAQGYLPKEELWASPSELELFLASDIEAPFHRPSQLAAPIVDLHWDIARRWRTDGKALDDLWTEASTTMLWGVRAYRLSPEWELLYLAVHAVRHRWQALKWLVDIHDYCTMRGVEWDRLAAKADGLGWGRALRLTLGLCRALLGTAVPEKLAEKPPRWVLAQLHGADGAWKHALIPAYVLDRRADRLGYLLRLLLRPTILERRALRVPAALSPVYHLLRPLLLAMRWTRPIAASSLKAWRNS